MEVEEAIHLIEAIRRPSAPQRWADLGCGSGLFSIALAHLLPEGSTIFCYDKQNQHIPNQVNGVDLQFEILDFEQMLPAIEPDGILMANSLHYVRDKPQFLTRWNTLLKPGGCYLIIEYDRETGNAWVPYPLSFGNLQALFANNATGIRKLAERKSVFGSIMYAAEIKMSET